MVDDEAEMQHQDESLAEPEPKLSAAERLRALEDEWFGADEHRLDGKVQRGHGSKWALLPPDKRAQHAALEKAVDAENAVIEARANLGKAEAKLAAAEAKAGAAARAA